MLILIESKKKNTKPPPPITPITSSHLIHTNKQTQQHVTTMSTCVLTYPLDLRCQFVPCFVVRFYLSYTDLNFCYFIICNKQKRVQLVLLGANVLLFNNVTYARLLLLFMIIARWLPPSWKSCLCSRRYNAILKIQIRESNVICD